MRIAARVRKSSVAVAIVVCTTFALIFGAQLLPNKAGTITEQAGGARYDLRPGSDPHLSLDAARRLNVGTGGDKRAAVAMAAADFDSDGIADVVTAAADGSLQFLKGNDPALTAMDPMSKEPAVHEPFAAKSLDATFGRSVDSLFAGDFNADGKQDILGSAAGSNRVALAAGNGRGEFGKPVEITIGAPLTAIAAGEIGKKDGQTDLAVAFTMKKRSFLAVYEHPEGAFKHTPEIFPLPAPATAIAVGNVDEDFYSDIAVACGDQLVVVHERGQAYPWDIVKDSGIKRPAAAVDARRMPFAIRSMAIGRFGERRGTSLAVLGSDGGIYQLEPERKMRGTSSKISREALSVARGLPAKPTDADDPAYAVMMPEVGRPAGEMDGFGNPVVDQNEVRAIGLSAYLAKQAEKKAADTTRPDMNAIAAATSKVRVEQAQLSARRKAAFLESISPHASPLKAWTVTTVATGLSGAGLLRVNVSDGDLDDLMVTSPTGPARVVSRLRDESGRRASHITEATDNGGTLGALPLKLNLDALDDILVLRPGSAVPDVMMSAPNAIFFVNNTNDDFTCDPSPGQCSLRGAITAANSSPGNDIIGFAISNGASTINLQAQLPPITSALSIQGGSLQDGTKAVEISGENITSGAADGLKVRASGCFIWNLAINRMPNFAGGGSHIGGNGITLESTSSSPNNGNNFVVGLFLGTDATGTIACPNASTGMLIFDSDSNAVGGAGSSFKNVMSGNTHGGYGLDVTGGNSNTFQNNIIGLNALGIAKLGNNSGVFLTGSDNKFGGDNAGEGNTVSGNGVPSADEPQRFCHGSGLNIAELYDANTNELLTHATSVRGNRIGTDPTGTTPLGNCDSGIYTSPLTETTIGSITQPGRNVVSDNGWTAIRCLDTFAEAYFPPSVGGACAIAGNNIGTDVSGNIGMGNDDRNFEGGVYRIFGNIDMGLNISFHYFGAPGGTTPGGACTGFCNLYSGNLLVNAQFASQFNEDIYSTGYGSMGIFNNSIGVNRDGDQALTNLQGVTTGILYGDYYLGGIGDDLGTPITLGNTISGQDRWAALISGGFANGNCAGTGTTMIVQGNRIGTDVTGTTAIPNGVATTGGSGPTLAAYILRGYADLGGIGGEGDLARNIISGNAGDGLLLSNACFTALPVSAPVTNNFIGVNKDRSPLGNGGSGLISSASFAVFGGDLPNEIAYNGANGVYAHAGVQVISSNGFPAIGVQIRGNSIHDNNGLGIDLGGTPFTPADGITPNDCLDGDVGPNLLQNFPVLMQPTTDGNGGTIINGFLRSSPSEDYTIDFYSNPTADPSQYGEGTVHIGSTAVRTTGNGFTTFTVTINGSFQNITATATDAFGDTSEFSCVAGQCVDPGLTTQNVEEVLGTEICIAPIVVNNTLDEDDGDINDQLCDSDTNQPGLQCSLRAAMQEAEHQSGPNAIAFSIPGGGPYTIQPTTPLPQMTQPVSIDATSQPGYAGSPIVTVTGTSTTGAYGFRLAGGTSLLRGLSIVNFKEQVGLSNSGGGVGNNRVAGCFVGLWPNGAPGTKSLQQFGISLVGATTNSRIGGSDPVDRNVVSGNGVGVAIVSGSVGNLVIGNYIGTDPQGANALGNDYGVSIQDSKGNRIGSSIGTDGNLISGNVNDGVEIFGTSSGNIVAGNLIGTDASGGSAVPNKRGVEIYNGASGNTVGGTAAAQRNVISGQDVENNSVGVLIGPDAGADNVVSGNYVGVSADGSAPLPNRVGVAVNADSQTVGSQGGFRNVILSSNVIGAYGIYLHPFFPNDELFGVKVLNNDVGVDTLSGTSSGEMGIFLNGNVKSAQITGNTVGHATLAGIRLLDGPHNNTIQNNLVGINSSDQAIPNGFGIVIKQADTNFVKNNVVSGNTGHGIVIGDGFGQNDRPSRAPKGSSGSFAINNIVTGNKVGTDADAANLVPNGDVGIGVAANARDNTIGGVGNLGNIVGGSTGSFGIGIFVGIIDDSQPQNVFPQNNKVLGNRVGVGPDFSGASFPNRYGIYVRNAVNTTVGGTSDAEANLVGNNEADGIRLFKPGTIDSTVSHNYVGVLPLGDSVPNGGDGISVDGVTNVSIEDNTVAGNQGNGIHLANMAPTPTTRPMGGGLLGTRLLGNVIGGFKDTNTGEFTALGNALNGILSEEVSALQIGSSAALANAANVVIGNLQKGVLVNGGVNNKIESMLVGTTPQGAMGMGNGEDGVKVVGSLFVEINKNTVSGNGTNGIAVSNLPPQQSGGILASISANIVGLSPAPLNGVRFKIPNLEAGCLFEDVNKLAMKATNDAARNFIGGNNGPGIVLRGISADNELSGTVVGTDENGSPNLGNQAGILVEGASRTAVGNINTALKTVISSNLLEGLKVDGSSAVGNLIKNCELQVNGSHGVLLTNGAAQNTVGGTEENAGNLISENGGSGVLIDATAGVGNVVDPNSIYGNTGPGIDLGNPGPTANDAGDADIGPNNLQNYPAVIIAGVDNNGHLIVSYKVDSDPVTSNSNYGSEGLYVEFFIADLRGQGKTFVGSDHYSAADHGAGSPQPKSVDLGDASLLGFAPGSRLTASATDADGNTSEFFPPFGPTAAHVTISGHVRSAAGTGVRNALLVLTGDNGSQIRVFTNAFGDYRFESAEAGHTYTLTVSRRGYSFSNATRIVTVVDDLTDEDFIADP